MIGFSVSEDMKEGRNLYIKKRVPTYLLAYLLTQIVKKLKISVEQRRVITTYNIIKH